MSSPAQFEMFNWSWRLRKHTSLLFCTRPQPVPLVPVVLPPGLVMTSPLATRLKISSLTRQTPPLGTFGKLKSPRCLKFSSEEKIIGFLEARRVIGSKDVRSSNPVTSCWCHPRPLSPTSPPKARYFRTCQQSSSFHHHKQQARLVCLSVCVLVCLCVSMFVIMNCVRLLLPNFAYLKLFQIFYFTKSLFSFVLLC